MMNMKKIMAMLMALSMMFAMAACGGEEATTEETAEKLVVGTSADYAPFEFHKMVEGKDTILGADISLAEKIAEDLGMELEIKDISFDVLLNELQQGTIDVVIAGMSADETRLKQADASDVYYDASYQRLVILEEKADTYTGADDFDGVKVAVQSGTIQHDMAIENLTGCEVVVLQSVNDVFNNLINGKVEAALVDGIVGDQYIDNNEALTFVDVDITSDEGTCVWVQKDDPKGLMEQINKTIDEVLAEDLYLDWLAEAEEQAAE